MSSSYISKQASKVTGLRDSKKDYIYGGLVGHIMDAVSYSPFDTQLEIDKSYISCRHLELVQDKFFEDGIKFDEVGDNLIITLPTSLMAPLSVEYSERESLEFSSLKGNIIEARVEALDRFFNMMIEKINEELKIETFVMELQIISNVNIGSVDAKMYLEEFLKEIGMEIVSLTNTSLVISCL